MSTLDIKLSNVATGETRIVALPTQPIPSWADLVQRVQQRFALDQPPINVTYVDDDGDEITVSSDDELRELWLGSVAQPSLSLAFSVARPVVDDQRESVRDVQMALLESVRVALEQDASLAHDLRDVLHDGFDAPYRPRHHDHHHHGQAYSRFAVARGGGGRRGGCPGPGGAGNRRHERWEMRSGSSLSSSSDSESEADQAGAERGRCRDGGRKGDKHSRHGRSPPRHHFPGPSPPPPPRHGHHGRHGLPPRPSGPPHGPPPPFALGFFGPPPPPPPPPFPSRGGRHGYRYGPPPFHPPPPPHGFHPVAADSFGNGGSHPTPPWHALADFFASPFYDGRH